MNYGIGVHGGTSRCYRFYQDMLECSRAAGKNDYYWKCKNEREDYLECLHERKLYDRLEKIEKEKKRLIKEGKYPPKPEELAEVQALGMNKT